MSFQNFIPTVWNAAIQRDLEKSLVFAEDCNREYEGNVSERGQTVKILGVGKPTIKDLTDRNGDIDGAEIIEDTSINMPINKIAYFNYMVGDVDKLQAVKGIKGVLNKETTEGLGDKVDKYIASFATAKEAVKGFSSAQEITKSNIMDKIDECLLKLYENDVKDSTKIVMTVSPKFYMILKQAYTDLDTNNSKLIKNGFVGMYNKIHVKMSNNVCKTTSGANTVDNIMIRTQRAIAYCNPMVHTEAYRPEKKFADAVKGYILYDAKIVRPKEMIVLNATY